MKYVVNLGLDPDLPVMVYADISLIYTLDFVPAVSGRKMPATETRINRLVHRAITDVRTALKIAAERAEDYLDFRWLVADTLCREYGFACASSCTNNILGHEMSGLIRQRFPDPTAWVPSRRF